MLALLPCRVAAPHAARAAPRRSNAIGSSAAESRRQRCGSVTLRARKPDAADFARAQAAVDALLHAAAGDASDAEAGEALPTDDGASSVLDKHIAEVAALGAELGLDRVGPANWNCGVFTGHALQGRLRRVLSSKLTLPMLSFGLFDAPPGQVTLLHDAPARIIKGASGRSRLPRGASRRGNEKLDSDSRANADRYAVQTPFILHREGGRPPLRGVNTVVGKFSIERADGAPRQLAVQFSRVHLSLTSDGGADDEEVAALLGERERALPEPARATLRVLLMTPTTTVTRSNLGSVAVLTRCDLA